MTLDPIIGLFTPQSFDLRATLAALQAEGLRVVGHTFPASGAAEPFPENLRTAVLVVPTPGVMSIGGPATGLRHQLAPSVNLMVCCPQVTASDRGTLRNCGVTEVISPASWEARAVGERVLGQLILHDMVQPRHLGPLRGGVRGMREVYHAIDKLAPHLDPVLILGETGTGKELVARELHRLSHRAGEFVAIDCGALAPELLQSELFGHERGAFTQAVTKRDGLLVEAGEGTVFLDEIGELPPPAQARLLRALEERKVRPVGSNKWRDIRARLLFATNRDLREECELGRFRLDLYARLCGHTLQLPPLRERRADIPWLVQGFLEELHREEEELNRKEEEPDRKKLMGKYMPDGALDCLFRHDWPMNVRELRAAVRDAAHFAAPDGAISVIRLEEKCRAAAIRLKAHTISFDPTADRWHDVLERAWSQYCAAILQATGGNKTAAAQLAGLSRSAFLEKLKNRPDLTAPPPA